MKESEEWEETLGSPSKPGLSSDEYGCVDVLMVTGRKLGRGDNQSVLRQRESCDPTACHVRRPATLWTLKRLEGPEREEAELEWS